MIEFDQRMAEIRRELNDAEREIPHQRRLELEARLDELERFEKTIKARPEQPDRMVIEILPEDDSRSAFWTVLVRDGRGRLLAASLSDDMPETPGEALASAGRVLDRHMALEGWHHALSADPESQIGDRRSVLLHGREPTDIEF